MEHKNLKVGMNVKFITDKYNPVTFHVSVDGINTHGYFSGQVIWVENYNANYKVGDRIPSWSAKYFEPITETEMNTTQEIAELKARLEQLEKQVKESEKKEWPSIGNTYFIINGCGIVYGEIWDGESHEQGAKAIGNIFRTRKEAENEVEARKVVEELRATEGRVDGYTHYDSIYGFEVGIDEIDTITGISEVGLYWKSKENAQKAIDKVGKDRIIAAAKHFGRV